MTRKKLAIRRPKKRNLSLAAAIVIFLLLFTAGSTLAFISMQTAPVVNVFLPSKVSCKVTEEFDGTTKSNVSVTNTGDIPAYVRVRLVSYRVDVNNVEKRIGGTAAIPDFTLGNGWVKDGNYYYYTSPVESQSSPATPLISSIELEEYTDADGGKQVIEVIAEAIQSQPIDAAVEAWGVTIIDSLIQAEEVQE